MIKESLFTIYDLQVKSDTVYQVTPKIDLNAPQAFQDNGTTKVLSSAVDDSVPGAIFDHDKNAWDTGMYLESRALNKAFPDETERKAVLKNIDKYIVKPIEKIKGVGALSHLATKEQNEFWDNYNIRIKKDEVFYTSKPDDLLKLFLAVLHRQVTPSTIATGNHEFAKSQYCIQDKESVVDRKQQIEMEQMKASGEFYSMLKNKRSDLIVILDYVGLRVSDKSDDAAITSVFNSFIKNKEEGVQNTKQFIQVVDKMASEAGEEELYTYAKLKELFSKGKIKQRKGDVYFDDELLGNSFKTAAAKVVADKELQKQLLEL